jgi:uncharacterized membrane protein YdbT with pleckstrin-like domain
MEPTAKTPAAHAALSARILDEGEIVIFAIKPSPWFVPLASWPVVLVAMLVAALAQTGDLASSLPQRTVFVLCVAVACVRVMMASAQWISRLYILTNLRVMRIRGIFQAEVFDCPLRRISSTRIDSTLGQRVLRLGNLEFDTYPDKPCDVDWLTISRPDEIKKMVDEAIAKVHSSGSRGA